MITLDDVKAYLAENKDDADVTSFIATLSTPAEVTPEMFQAYLSTDEGKAIVQPMIDQVVTKAVKTRDAANASSNEQEIKRRVAAELLKLNPKEEPWQKEIRELKEENERERKERARSDLKRQIVEEASKIGVDPFFIEDFMPDTIESGKLYLQRIKAYSDALVKKASNELMASQAAKPGTGNARPSGAIDFSKLSDEEIQQMDESGELDEAILRIQKGA